jgi:hypothetical protein
MAAIDMLHSMETEVPGTASESQSETAKRGFWPFPIEWAVVLLLIVTLSLLIAHNRRTNPAGDVSRAYTEKAAPQGATVSLTIDFGNGAKREFTGVEWSPGMTAGDLMHAASLMSPGLKYEVRGTAKMTLLTSLDGVANGSGAGRYWLYEINGRPADVSFAVKPLEPGDRVLWVFKRPE